MAKTDSWFKRNRILSTLAPIAIIGIGLFCAQLDGTPAITYKPEVVMPGYETTPGGYYIEASSHKEWGDYWAHKWGWALLGAIIIVAGTFAYIGYVEAQVKDGTWAVIMAIWLAGLLIIMIPFYNTVSNSKYETVLNAEQYADAKGNLDAIFPIKK